MSAGRASTVDGATAYDAVDQLVRDPGGLLRARVAAALPDLAEAVGDALAMPGVVDLVTGTVTVNHTATAGRFGWSADVTAGPPLANSSVPLALRETAECDQSDEGDDQADPEAPDDHQHDADDHDDRGDEPQNGC